jgi:HAD superfamily hydrolase (TIGR01548 family)
MEKLNLLIFDMDGVLIDVAGSYRETIRQTVRIYLETCLGFKKKTGGVTRDDISLFKSAGGFNNDWDLTSGLLIYLISRSSLPPSPKREKFSSIPEAVFHLKTRSSPFHGNGTPEIRGKNLPRFIKKVKTAGGGLKGVRKVIGAPLEGWVYGEGDLNRENLVKRIFQEVYLGKKFTSYYHLHPLFFRGDGYYLREKTLIPKAILSALHKKVRLGIASGRPRFEAELALKKFRMLSYFDSIVTLDECMKEEDRIFRLTGRRVKLSKPHPYSLLKVIEEIGLSSPQCGYVGDVVDDMLAARAVKKKYPIVAIGFLRGRPERKTLKDALARAGADLVIESPKEFLQFINGIK